MVKVWLEYSVFYIDQFLWTKKNPPKCCICIYIRCNYDVHVHSIRNDHLYLKIVFSTLINSCERRRTPPKCCICIYIRCNYDVHVHNIRNDPLYLKNTQILTPDGQNYPQFLKKPTALSLGYVTLSGCSLFLSFEQRTLYAMYCKVS